jgi:hypothetical protein
MSRGAAVAGRHAAVANAKSIIGGLGRYGNLCAELWNLF